MRLYRSIKLENLISCILYGIRKLDSLTNEEYKNYPNWMKTERIRQIEQQSRFTLTIREWI